MISTTTTTTGVGRWMEARPRSRGIGRRKENVLVTEVIVASDRWQEWRGVSWRGWVLWRVIIFMIAMIIQLENSMTRRYSNGWLKLLSLLKTVSWRILWLQENIVRKRVTTRDNQDLKSTVSPRTLEIPRTCSVVLPEESIWVLTNTTVTQHQAMVMNPTSPGNIEQRDHIGDKWKEEAQIKSTQDVAPDHLNSVWENRKSLDGLVSFLMQSKVRKHQRFMYQQTQLTWMESKSFW